jgi:hypothetical protein
MSNDQKALLDMDPGDTKQINGHTVMKSGQAWVINGKVTHYDLAMTLRALKLANHCPCGKSDREGHPKVGFCSAGLGGVRT